jgi:DNA-binding HxlR family transcriptional regulator
MRKPRRMSPQRTNILLAVNEGLRTYTDLLEEFPYENQKNLQYHLCMAVRKGDVYRRERCRKPRVKASPRFAYYLTKQGKRAVGVLP